jgi:hypothetical protein
MDGQAPQQNYYLAPTPQSEARVDASVIDKMLDMTSTIEMFKRELMGQKFNPKEQKWEKETEPIMTDEGINEITSDLHFHLNSVNALGILDQRKVNLAVREAASAENLKLLLNKSRCKISDGNQITVGIAFLNIIMSMYSQAKEGKLQQRILEQISRHETTQIEKPLPQPGILGGLIPKLR